MRWRNLRRCFRIGDVVVEIVFALALASSEV